MEKRSQPLYSLNPAASPPSIQINSDETQHMEEDISHATYSGATSNDIPPRPDSPNNVDLPGEGVTLLRSDQFDPPPIRIPDVDGKSYYLIRRPRNAKIIFRYEQQPPISGSDHETKDNHQLSLGTCRLELCKENIEIGQQAQSIVVEAAPAHSDTAHSNTAHDEDAAHNENTMLNEDIAREDNYDVIIRQIGYLGVVSLVGFIIAECLPTCP
jgi:hypothetical protein